MTQDHRSQQQPDPATRTLCQQDADALDALMETRAAGRETGPMPPDTRERTEHIKQVLSLLETDSPPFQDIPDELRARTLRAVRDARQRAQFTRQVEQLTGTDGGRPGIPITWRQVLAASLILVLGGSILLPMLESSNAAARQQICLSNLAAAGQAFGAYANDHQGVMPVTASLARADTNTQTARPNSANLYRLISGEYLTPRQLACPENEHFDRATQASIADDNWAQPELVSYSYQNQKHTTRLNQWPAMAILADRNPLYRLTPDGYRFDDSLPENTSSTIHHKPGQNVLQASGNASWWTTPLLNNNDITDNIWTANTAQNPLPTRHDSFLTP
ncbi:hypothetical protein [Mucisphaera calidilacus]|uniref:Uncharacterized protein n=1 Tax=Mucisphaera calidilacus TaxID=2527982 RepID=A0A518C0G4_9BACT|nr:hypothetical protein [Mucisphaera calidilacus]QDU72697.1 hypothetical protein Pan265_25710 [Mucisphaera calidilacus]